MARIASVGFETGVVTEWGTGGTGITIVTSPVKSGVYAGRFNTATNTWSKNLAASQQTTGVYVTLAFRAAAWPTANADVFYLVNDSFQNRSAALNISSTGVLSCGGRFERAGTTTTLSLNTWYKLSLYYDGLSEGVVEGKVNDVTFGTATGNRASSFADGWRTGRFYTGNATFDFYVDEIAVNDVSGVSDNSWPTYTPDTVPAATLTGVSSVAGLTSITM